MDLKRLANTLRMFLKKYKFAAIILLAGLLLMMMPSVSTKQQASQEQAGVENVTVSIDESLSVLFSQVIGAGKVSVLLTTEEGQKTIYQMNQDSNKSKDTESNRSDTVTVTDSERNQSGLVQQIRAPVYRGAVILCQGADSAEVRFSLVDAVSKVTGLRSDQISVLKMK